MNLETSYMGMKLRNPLIIGSSSLTGSLNNIKTCEEKGAAAIVLKSLYEEQIVADQDLLVDQDEMYQWYPEALDYVSGISKDNGKERYLQLIHDCKSHVEIPVIASVNCFTAQVWPQFAAELENAGADAVELNITIMPQDEAVDPMTIESEYMHIVESVKEKIKIPVSVKISAYFSNIKRIVSMLHKAGASGIVLFNRYYRPDIDIDSLKMITRDSLSCPEELTHSLRWIGLLSGKTPCDLVASTGIHDAAGVIKQILAGARATEICSVLYENGIGYIEEIISDTKAWMKRKGYENFG